MTILKVCWGRGRHAEWNMYYMIYSMKMDGVYNPYVWYIILCINHTTTTYGLSQVINSVCSKRRPLKNRSIHTIFSPIRAQILRIKLLAPFYSIASCLPGMGCLPPPPLMLLRSFHPLPPTHINESRVLLSCEHLDEVRNIFGKMANLKGGKPTLRDFLIVVECWGVNRVLLFLLTLEWWDAVLQTTCLSFFFFFFFFFFCFFQPLCDVSQQGCFWFFFL